MSSSTGKLDYEQIAVATMLTYQILGADRCSGSKFRFSQLDLQDKLSITLAFVRSRKFPIESWRKSMQLSEEAANRRLSESHFLQDFLKNMLHYIEIDLDEGLAVSIPAYHASMLAAAKKAKEKTDFISEDERASLRRLLGDNICRH